MEEEIENYDLSLGDESEPEIGQPLEAISCLQKADVHQIPCTSCNSLKLRLLGLENQDDHYFILLSCENCGAIINTCLAKSKEGFVKKEYSKNLSYFG